MLVANVTNSFENINIVVMIWQSKFYSRDVYSAQKASRGKLHVHRCLVKTKSIDR